VESPRLYGVLILRLIMQSTSFIGGQPTLTWCNFQGPGNSSINSHSIVWIEEIAESPTADSALVFSGSLHTDHGENVSRARFLRLISAGGIVMMPSPVIQLRMPAAHASTANWSFPRPARDMLRTANTHVNYLAGTTPPYWLV
jgi:hypothetical protein